MAENTLQENINKALYKNRVDQREQAGGGKALSPMDAAGMGANPDQAKMVGVKHPGSLEAAFAQAQAAKGTPQELQYEAILREKTFEESQLTPEQKKAQEAKEDLKGLGTLDTMVEQAIKQAWEAPMAVAPETADDILKGTGVDETAQADIEAAVTAYITEVTSAQGDATKIAAANTKFVQATQGKFAEGISATTVLESLASSVDIEPSNLIKATAQAVADGTVDVEDLTMQYLEDNKILNVSTDAEGRRVYNDFGDEGLTEDELVSILGPEFKTMTVAEIADAVENRVKRDFHQQANIQKTISDPNVSPVLREALQGKLAQIEASGMAQIEQDAEEAAANVRAAGSVIFNGQVIELDTLLSDSFITSEIESFLMLDEDKQKESKFFKDNPAFANMVQQTFQTAVDAGDSYKEALEALRNSNDEFNKAAEESMSAMSVPPSDDVQKMLGYNADELHTGTFTPDYLWTMGAENPQVFEVMNSWSKETRDAFAEWKATASEEEVKALFSDVRSARAFNDLTNMNTLLSGVKKESENELQQLLELTFGISPGNVSGSETALASFAGISPDKYLEKLKYDALLGGTDESKAAYEYFKNILDADGDGVQDGPDQIRATLKAMGNMSMADLASKVAAMTSSRKGLDAGGGLHSLASLTEDDQVPFTPSQMREIMMAPGVLENGHLDVEKLLASTGVDGSKNFKMKPWENAEMSLIALEALHKELARVGGINRGGLIKKLRELREYVKTQNPNKDIQDKDTLNKSLNAQDPLKFINGDFNKFLKQMKKMVTIDDKEKKEIFKSMVKKAKAARDKEIEKYKRDALSKTMIISMNPAKYTKKKVDADIKRIQDEVAAKIKALSDKTKVIEDWYEGLNK